MNHDVVRLSRCRTKDGAISTSDGAVTVIKSVRHFTSRKSSA